MKSLQISLQTSLNDFSHTHDVRRRFKCQEIAFRGHPVLTVSTR